MESLNTIAAEAATKQRLGEYKKMLDTLLSANNSLASRKRDNEANDGKTAADMWREKAVKDYASSFFGNDAISTEEYALLVQSAIDLVDGQYVGAPDYSDILLAVLAELKEIKVLIGRK